MQPLPEEGESDGLLSGTQQGSGSSGQVLITLILQNDQIMIFGLHGMTFMTIVSFTVHRCDSLIILGQMYCLLFHMTARNSCGPLAEMNQKVGVVLRANSGYQPSI